jgi:uncharacterized protein (TIRG00374 family)
MTDAAEARGTRETRTTVVSGTEGAHTRNPVMRSLSALRFLTSRRWRWIIVAAAVAAMALVLLARGELRPMAESVIRADWRWVLVALALMLVSLTLRSLALRLIGGACEAQPRLRDALSSTSIGLLANAVVPVRIGALVNPYVLFVLLRRRGVHVPFATTLGMTVTEQLFSAATFVLLGLASVSLLAVPAWAESALIGCAAALGVLFALAALVQVRRERRRAAGLSGAPAAVATRHHPHGWRGALLTALPHFADAQRVLARPWLALLVAGVQAAAWGIQLAAAVAVLHAVHLGGAGWAGAALVLLLTNLIGIVPLTPGNVGTFQLAATAALAAAGAPAGPALAFALGLQALQLLVGVSAGLVSLSLQDLSFSELAGKTREAADLLRRGVAAPPGTASPPAPGPQAGA